MSEIALGFAVSGALLVGTAVFVVGAAWGISKNEREWRRRMTLAARHRRWEE